MTTLQSSHDLARPAERVGVMALVAGIGLLLTVMVSGCGAGSSTAALPTAVLQSISLSPTSASIAQGSTQQFAAIGHFDDATTQPLTTGLVWSSGNTDAATIDSDGLASPVATGTSTIMALHTESGFSGSTTLSVCGDSGSTADSWSTKTPMPTPRYAFTLAVVDCIVYAIGGNTGGGTAIGTVEAFDPAADAGAGAWTAKTDMPTPRFGLTSQVVNGIVYVFGGKDSSKAAVDTVEAFDPAGNSGAGSWSTKTSMTAARFAMTSQVVNGIIYLFGGQSAGATVEAFDPAGAGGMGSWASKTDMTTARNELTAQAVNGIVYAIGGQSGCSGLAATEAFDPAGSGGAGAWSTKPDMTGRKALASAAVNGIIFAIGGIDSCDGGTLLQTVEAFDPAANSGGGSWSAKADMPTARQSLSSAQVNGIVYAMGGNDDSGTVFDTVEAYTSDGAGP